MRAEAPERIILIPKLSKMGSLKIRGGMPANLAESVQPQIIGNAPATRGRVLNTTDKVLSRARKIYSNQLDRTPQMKARAIRRALVEVGDPMITEPNFLAKYVERMAILLDSKNFNQDCARHHQDAYTMAIT